jgi:ParB-like chromosome segregation protein Spo0J
MEVTTAHIDDVIPYARNPRNNEAAVDKVAASIREYGWRQPIVVDKEMTIIAGHTRLMAAMKLGLEKVPIHIADGLTDAQVKAYRIADNRVSQEAEWDNDLLKLEFDDLLDVDFDLGLTGFNDDELKNLLEDDEQKTTTSQDVNSEYEVVIECVSEEEQERVYKIMTDKGYKCRVLTI